MKYIKKFFGATFSPEKIIPNILFALVILILISALFPSRLMNEETGAPVKKGELLEYEVGGRVPIDIYIRQFDAWQKGQIELDLDVDQRLAELENPYDPTERKQSGARYNWDYAFFDGKYYSYFGIAPILTVHAPVYAVTGKLPDIPMTCFILAIAAIIATAFAYREVVLRFIKKPNLWLFLLGLAGSVCASGVYLGVLCSDMYYVAVLSAQVFSMAFVALAVRSMREEKLWARMIMLVFAAIALTLTVWSRPTVALMCVAVFPLFIEFIFKIRKDTLKDGLLTVASFALPLMAGAAAVMWYNYARFGSPLDFGANYQLTVSDVSLNTIDFKYLFSSVFSYFLCPMWQAEAKPFIEMQRITVLPSGSRYFYADRACGAFAYGLPLGILAYPRLATIENHRGEKDGWKTSVVCTTAVLALVIAFSDFCLGGVNMRYVYDISVMLTLVSAAILINLTEKSDGVSKIITGAVTAALSLVSIWTNMGVVETIRIVLGA